MATPNIDAAIRAGCDDDVALMQKCTWPECQSGQYPCNVIPLAVPAALRAAIPKEPPAEVIEAMARELYREGYRPWEECSDQNIVATFSATEHDGDCTNKCYTCLLCEAEPARRQAIAAYKAQPIYRELWS